MGDGTLIVISMNVSGIRTRVVYCVVLQLILIALVVMQLLDLPNRLRTRAANSSNE